MAEDSATSTPNPTPTCTLSDEDAQRRLEQRSPVLVERFDGATVHDDRRITLWFEGIDDSLPAIASFVAAERNCCSFADYQISVEPPYAETKLEITCPEGTTEMFRDEFVAVLDA